MRTGAHGQVRCSQVVTTWGPGSLLDLPRYSVIVGGLDTWSRDLEPIDEPRLVQKLRTMTGLPSLELKAPPEESNDPRQTGKRRGIGAFQFPEWFLVQTDSRDEGHEKSRRLVHRRLLDNGQFEKKTVVPTRFVRACRKGHVDDLDWYVFVHGTEDGCRSALFLDEIGTSGDLGDLRVRCQCGKKRSLSEATVWEANALDYCKGRRPWLGRHDHESCQEPSRLLIRTATNAYFPQVMSVLSLPDRARAIDGVMADLWNELKIVDDAGDLRVQKKHAHVAAALDPFDDAEVLAAIRQRKSGRGSDRPVKEVELEAILAAQEGFGDDVPIDPNFHVRRLPERVWRRGPRFDDIEDVIQLHRLREVLALTGFTRFEAVMPDIHGEYETDVERAPLAADPSWFPAVENRGEGVFVRLRDSAIRKWLARPAVRTRLAGLKLGHDRWLEKRGNKGGREFPGGPYVLLHTLSHLLIQSLAMRCGYPASSIRERVYAEEAAGQFGILLYTGSPDAEGTLGGLVQQARQIETHLAHALRMAALCSNDPICAQHAPGESLEERFLHGAACHGCALIAETSCEMRNDYLDRALLVPVIGRGGEAFFGKVE